MYFATKPSAHAGADYTAVSGLLNFQATEFSKTIAIPVMNNLSSQGDRQFAVELIRPTGGLVLLRPKTAVVTISDASGVPQ